MSVAVLAQGLNKHGWLAQQGQVSDRVVLNYLLFARCVPQVAGATKQSYQKVPRRLCPSAVPIARGLVAPARFRCGPCLASGSRSLWPWPRWAQSSLAWGFAPCRAQGRCQFPSGDLVHTRALRRSEATSLLSCSGVKPDRRG